MVASNYYNPLEKSHQTELRHAGDGKSLQ